MVSPQIKNLAQRLLAFEGAHPLEPDVGTDVAARVVEQFRKRLIRLVGVEGYRSLLLRALALARSDNRELNQVQVGADGSLQDVAEMSEVAGLRLVGELIGLLTTFIGESLTMQLVRDAWPEAAAVELTPIGTVADVNHAEAIVPAASNEEIS